MKDNWIVTCYDENDKETCVFTILNRSEQEANREAMHSAEVRQSFDWSLRKEGASSLFL